MFCLPWIFIVMNKRHISLVSFNINTDGELTIANHYVCEFHVSKRKKTFVGYSLPGNSNTAAPFSYIFFIPASLSLSLCARSVIFASIRENR